MFSAGFLFTNCEQTLEMFNFSQTLFSMIVACFSLRSFGIWSLCLLIVWAFSPTGGQGILRSISLEPTPVEAAVPLIYYPSNNWSVTPKTSWTGASSSSDIRTLVRTIFGSALAAPSAAALHSNGSSSSFGDTIDRLGGPEEAARISQRDVWNSVRIPFLEKLPEYDASNPFDWVHISNTTIAPYSSIMGVPLRGLPISEKGNLSVTLQTNYHTLHASTG